MTGTPGLLRDLRSALIRAAASGMVSDRNNETFEDIADRVIVWLLTGAPGPDDIGTGWAHVRVLFPKTNYASRIQAIVALVEADMSRAAVGRLFNLSRSQISRIYDAEKNPDRD